MLTSGIDYMKEPLTDSRRVTAKSILKLTPKKEHHNTTFTCQAQNTADRNYRAVKLKLEVSYVMRIKSIAHLILYCGIDQRPNRTTLECLGGQIVVRRTSAPMLIVRQQPQIMKCHTVVTVVII